MLKLNLDWNAPLISYLQWDSIFKSAEKMNRANYYWSAGILFLNAPNMIDTWRKIRNRQWLQFRLTDLMSFTHLTSMAVSFTGVVNMMPDRALWGTVGSMQNFLSGSVLPYATAFNTVNIGAMLLHRSLNIWRQKELTPFISSVSIATLASLKIGVSLYAVSFTLKVMGAERLEHLYNRYVINYAEKFFTILSAMRIAFKIVGSPLVTPVPNMISGMIKVAASPLMMPTFMVVSGITWHKSKTWMENTIYQDNKHFLYNPTLGTRFNPMRDMWKILSNAGKLELRSGWEKLPAMGLIISSLGFTSLTIIGSFTYIAPLIKITSNVVLPSVAFMPAALSGALISVAPLGLGGAAIGALYGRMQGNIMQGAKYGAAIGVGLGMLTLTPLLCITPVITSVVLGTVIASPVIVNNLSYTLQKKKPEHEKIARSLFEDVENLHTIFKDFKWNKHIKYLCTIDDIDELAELNYKNFTKIDDQMNSRNINLPLGVVALASVQNASYINFIVGDTLNMCINSIQTLAEHIAACRELNDAARQPLRVITPQFVKDLRKLKEFFSTIEENADNIEQSQEITKILGALEKCEVGLKKIDAIINPSKKAKGK